MIIFCAVIAVWLLVGVIGMLNARTTKTNWFIIAFMGFFPFIPLIAKACGMM